MNIKIAAVIFAFTSITYLHGAVTEKLAANSKKIEILRKEIKNGSFNIHKKCQKCGSCKVCTNCKVNCFKH